MNKKEKEALKVVLELATQNALSEKEVCEDVDRLAPERIQQQNAIEIVDSLVRH